MRLMFHVFKVVLAASCLAIAACGGSNSAVSPGGNVAAASLLQASLPVTASPNGTSIPSVTQIIDGSGNVWTVSSGVIYENGALGGYSKAVTLLLYAGNTIYQENASGGWWFWNGSTWISSGDPRKTPSANGTIIPTADQIIDGNGNIWAVSAGLIYENGVLAGYSKAVTQLVYDNNVIYQENAAGGWWSWNGSTWVSTNDPEGKTTTLAIQGTPPASDAAGQAYDFVPATQNPGGGPLTFSIANMPAWASFNTATGALTGIPSSALAGTYANISISVSNGSATATLPAFSITVTSGSATLEWVAPTQNVDGTPLTDLAGYTIYYGTDAGEMTETVQLNSPGATSYVVANLGAGTYYFAISAYASDGTQSAQSPVGSKTIP